MSSKKINTKIRILDTTWKLLEARDKNTRMSDIAKAVGISRQALYLHFPTRAALLIATTRHVDYVKKVDRRLEASRAARTGIERLDAFIEAFGGYIPEIHGLSVALRGMLESDGAVRDAWNDRMQAVRHGCEAAVRAIAKDGQLNPDLSEQAATDFLWTLLSVENWERLVHECGWTQSAYQERMQTFAKVALLKKPPLTT